MGILHFDRVETAPGMGAAHPFSPAKEAIYTKNEQAARAQQYKRWLLDRHKSDPGFRQHTMLLVHDARMGNKVVVNGPFRKELQAFLAYIIASSTKGSRK